MAIPVIHHQNHTIIVFVSDYSPYPLVYCPHCVQQIPFIPRKCLFYWTFWVFVKLIVIIPLLFKDWIFNVWVRNTDEKNCPAKLIWKIKSFTYFSSAYTKQYCPFFGFSFIFKIEYCIIDGALILKTNIFTIPKLF